MNANYGLNAAVGSLQSSYDTLYWKEKNKLLAADNELYQENNRQKQIQDLYQHIMRLDTLLEKAYGHIEELQKPIKVKDTSGLSVNNCC